MILHIAMLNLSKFIIEFIGTFIFLSVIFGVGEPIPIVVALLAVIYFGGSVSGGHFNPAVTYAMMVDGKINTQTALGYAGSQIAGAYAAWYFYNNVIKKNRSA
jgi:aquaporin Z